MRLNRARSETELAHTCNWLVTLVDNQLLGVMQSQAITGFRTILNARALILGYKTSAHGLGGGGGGEHGLSQTRGRGSPPPNQTNL